MKRKLICKADLQKLKTIGWILVAQNINLFNLIQYVKFGLGGWLYD